jgi:hypothetical protein
MPRGLAAFTVPMRPGRQLLLMPHGHIAYHLRAIRDRGGQVGQYPARAGD